MLFSMAAIAKYLDNISMDKWHNFWSIALLESLFNKMKCLKLQSTNYAILCYVE